MFTLRNLRILIALLGTSALIYSMMPKQLPMPSSNLFRNAVKPTFNKVETPTRYFIDKDNNKIQIFDDNTLYPKPGGGYCNMTPIKDKEEFFWYMENPTAKCKNLKEFAYGYRVCLDDFKNYDNCVGLCFGVNDQWNFDDDLIDKLGCRVYSFDPTMDKEDFERRKGQNQFYNLGLSSFKGVKIMQYGNRRNRKCKVDQYANIVNMLGLAEKEIDFLKIDIEGSELDFFLDTAANHPELLMNIKQIQLEFHSYENCCFWHSGNSRDTSQFDMMKIVQILLCHGFACTHTVWNPTLNQHFKYNGKERSLAYITTWIRV